VLTDFTFDQTYLEVKSSRRMAGLHVVIRTYNLPDTKRSACMLLLCKVNYVSNVNVCLIPTKTKCECKLEFSVTLG
jgi:hypothetical protein